MIKVSPVQKGNALLEYLSNASWHYDNAITPDYEVNSSVGILFLSLRFHVCKPEYIQKRVRAMRPYKVRALLVYVDIPNYGPIIRELFDSVPLTMVLGFSIEECSRYVRGFEMAGGRSVDAIRRGQNDTEGFLQRIPKINKTDAQQIACKCGTLLGFISKTPGEMEEIAGIGKLKAEEISRFLDMRFE
ncbi:DNA repair protein Ercc1 (rad10/Swi10) [Ordospora pajunii]|uniref:DNA repair protein Ercc1 (rad10/Swi10) n=1 Tax=Ordospora pajunii TaxID=3039483 RepID=UPI00295267FF|nr:DNA repair protein Ercc1 (rad10/Swi10) [Ordospora pajunii]KAH9411454.1 DNA repair protein Ercc1 (rad10/Swi10) [Ordospora pajunii]